MKGDFFIPYLRKIIRSGDVLEIEEYYSNDSSLAKLSSSASDPVNPKKALYEYRSRVKKLSRLINANFSSGDLFVTLTFRKSVSTTQAKRDLLNFIRSLKRRRARLRLPPLKYISVTELGVNSKNKHHHLLINNMPADDVISLWKHGKVLISRLSPYSDYTGLAHYITKENKRKNENRWRRSHNLLVPQPQIFPVNPSPHNIKLPLPFKDFHVVVNENYFLESAGIRKYLKAIAPSGHDWAGGDQLFL